MKILTIIVPVYNVEDFLPKCLDSLIMSKKLMEQVEVIVINDGIIDRSSMIAHHYSQHFPKTFIVIDKVNAGHGSVWNLGVGMASGKYLRFLDSDDWFHTENLSKLVELLNRCDVDVIFSPINKYYLSEKRYEESNYFSSLKENYCYDANQFNWLALGSEMEITNFHYSTYKTSILRPLMPLFLEGQGYDDSILFIVPIIMAKKFMYYNKIIYNYLLGRDGQTADLKTRQRNFKALESVKKEMIAFAKTHSDISVEKRRKVESVLTTAIWRHYELLSSLDYTTSKKELRAWDKFLKTEYPNYRKYWKIKVYMFLPFVFYYYIQRLFL